ncbi:Hypothetical protein FKW44_010685 [Caligus rogercresseyi]|uniref:Uncharacterized protein n=1 Tax=Caligus rogercresseyi TaxID=217165 RepID=A0A7T8HHZ0_CALRO|nr:Hypothetical protein FKW44_010685 [Caligus rogercresseyi]
MEVLQNMELCPKSHPPQVKEDGPLARPKPQTQWIIPLQHLKQTTLDGIPNRAGHQDLKMHEDHKVVKVGVAGHQDPKMLEDHKKVKVAVAGHQDPKCTRVT